MKQFIIILFALVSLSGIAQNPLPFVEEGKMWIYTRNLYTIEDSVFSQLESTYDVYELKDDTLIGNKTYKKLYLTTYKKAAGEDAILDIPCRLYDFALREEEGKVFHFHYAYEDSGETFWFDFNQKGWTNKSDYGCGEKYKVSIQEIIPYAEFSDRNYYHHFIDDPSRKMWTINSESPIAEKEYILEGVGLINKNGIGDYPCSETPLEDLETRSLSCYDGSGKLIFGKDLIPKVPQRKPLPFVEEGKMWTITFTLTYGGICDPDHGIYEPYREEYQRYVMEGDTLINGKTYKKIYDRSVFVYYEDNAVEEKDELANFAVREEDGVVYHYHYTDNVSGKENIWFDFNLGCGDMYSTKTWTYTYHKGVPLLGEVKIVKPWTGKNLYGGEIYWDGKDRKCWVVDFFESGYSFYDNVFENEIIEGVGHRKGLLEVSNQRPAQVSPPCLASVHDGSGKLIFGTDIREEINNYVNGIAPITADKPADNAIYDLSGRRLLQAPSQGFYIQGGKKRLAR